MQRVLDGGDPAGYAPATPSEIKLNLGVLEKRVFLGVEALPLGDEKRGHPVGVVLIETKRQVNKRL
jgi:hypothetical protein